MPDPSARADSEAIAVDGLYEAAEIRVDRWGIPHLKAASEADLFFLQGFNAARDRLWQIDLWRKRGLGLLAADFGPGYLAQDHAARHFLYRGDMVAEWAAYSADAEAICRAFAAGINAYVALTEREPARLSPEFSLFGTRPARWQAEDVVRIRTHALTRNAVSEIVRANVLSRSDAATDALRSRIDPPANLAAVPGLDLADVPMAALRLFKLATAPVTFETERLAATMDEAWRWTEVTDLGDIVRATTEEGSNNWVVHGSRTATGRPIVASDPHRAQAVPSLRYLVHLTAPGFDAIGAGEPSAPGISIGHNGTTAFGLTIFGADQEDVYVYETKAGDPDRYRYRDGFEPFRRIRESFDVKGHEPQDLTLSFTRHGPVLHEDRVRQRAVAVRSVWLEPGASAYLGSLSAMRAGSVADFGAALTHWGTPSVNHVCADTTGDVAWYAAGFTPVRRNWNGLLPVPGDGSHEWDGFLPAKDLPHLVNPAEGFVATANEMNLPGDRASDAPGIGYEWVEPSRAERIKAVLREDPAHSLEAAGRLQNDVVSLPAVRLSRLLTSDGVKAGATGDAAAALDLLAGWDGALAAGSAEAALFEVWWMKHLRPALLAKMAPDAKVRALLQPGHAESLLALLEAPDARFGSEPIAARDHMLAETLAAAFADCRRRLGEDPAGWRWGDLHQAYFEHAATSLRKEGEAGWDVGPLPLGGSRSTPMHAGYRMSDFRVIAGASVRLVMDVGDWDASICVNAPGQSGDPASPHYGDLAPLWATGGYVPLLYSESRIAEETQMLIQLVPAGLAERGA
ncbi:penicillin acylase family protein [Aurantimonas sp. VKM B-3413]|uniref:penicillin acylase family protein n=1 Tax=Aurantimonas sp. VKM B-3413 TaxID=2779401 RepID=UPI001E61CBBC|nr:penicillin acylase family protein [Aurantimonas sp. VKM B-3413]MCB8839472.1 penicillin acylase family protein [Aurantimonas sp. VKM B-3413]